MLTQLVQSLRTAATALHPALHPALLPLLDALHLHATELQPLIARLPSLLAQLSSLKGELKSSRRLIKQLTATNSQQKQRLQELSFQLESETSKRVNAQELQNEAQKQAAQLQRELRKLEEAKRGREMQVQCELLTPQQLTDLEQINLNCKEENLALLLMVQEWSRDDKDSEEDNDHSTVASSETTLEVESEDEEEEEVEEEEEEEGSEAAPCMAHRLLNYFWIKSKMVLALATSQ